MRLRCLIGVYKGLLREYPPEAARAALAAGWAEEIEPKKEPEKKQPEPKVEAKAEAKKTPKKPAPKRG